MATTSKLDYPRPGAGLYRTASIPAAPVQKKKKRPPPKKKPAR